MSKRLAIRLLVALVVPGLGTQTGCRCSRPQDEPVAPSPAPAPAPTLPSRPAPAPRPLPPPGPPAHGEPKPGPSDLGKTEEWLRVVDAWQDTLAMLVRSESPSAQELEGRLEALAEARGDANRLVEKGLISNASADVLRIGLGMVGDWVQDALAARDGRSRDATVMVERLRRVTPALDRLSTDPAVIPNLRQQVRLLLSHRIAHTKAALNAAPDLVDNAAVDSVAAARAVATKLSRPLPASPD